MCGIVAVLGDYDNLIKILLDSLQALEYRGYDSSGVALIDGYNNVILRKTPGKLIELVKSTEDIKDIVSKIGSKIGIGHTRWATHGEASKCNAHPHVIGGRLVLVHNGVIENYQELKRKLNLQENDLLSDTDTEVMGHAVYTKLIEGKDLLLAVQEATALLEGSYAAVFMDANLKDRLVAVRVGSPLIVGITDTGYMLASDLLAFQGQANKFIFLEDGDTVDLDLKHGIKIYDNAHKVVTRTIESRAIKSQVVSKGHFKYFMKKEIFEQDSAIHDTLLGRIVNYKVPPEVFGNNARKILEITERVQIVACGTSYHAGMISKYWFESLLNIPVKVDVASDFRYRKVAHEPNTLLIAISQSGETADTIAAVKNIKNNFAELYTGILGICNVAESTLVRESNLTFLTNAGPEIGVASTKGFSTQLVALLLLANSIADVKNLASPETAKTIAHDLLALPQLVSEVFKLDSNLKTLASLLIDKEHLLIIARGVYYPIAMEGALKIKELSYIHAEAYFAGELKHGPLALVDKNMPIIFLAPDDALLVKVQVNMQEAYARGGDIIVFTEEGVEFDLAVKKIALPRVTELNRPILYAVALQLLAYHIADLKGKDVDQPRNLAKSVTVE